jgi:hypothetical protein
VDLSAAGSCVRPVMMAFLAGTEPKNTCGPSRGAPKSETAASQAGEPGASPAKAPTQSQ